MEESPSAANEHAENGGGLRCRFLEWDSSFFGCRIARLEGNRLRRDELDGVMRWCATEQIDCLYFLADSGCAETTECAERAGFGLKDLRVTYEWKSSPARFRSRPEIAVRPHRESDVEPLVAIARTAHTDSRFFFDRRFDRSAAALLFETWIRKACAGAADQVLVAEAGGEIAGYLSCQLSKERAGQIGLLAVGSRFQGRGIGRALVMGALEWFMASDATGISVVTQGRNVAAQRLYQSTGFLTRAIESWYHKWFR